MDVFGSGEGGEFHYRFKGIVVDIIRYKKLEQRSGSCPRRSVGVGSHFGGVGCCSLRRCRGWEDENSPFFLFRHGVWPCPLFFKVVCLNFYSERGRKGQF